MTQERKILYLPPVGLSEDILSPEAISILDNQGTVIWNELDRNYTSDELLEMIPGAAVVITSWGSPQITAEHVAAADDLQIVGHAAGSVKTRLAPAGHERGIVLLSAADVIAESVAEYTLWAMLSGQRNLFPYEKSMKVERGWKPAHNWPGHSLYAKKVGLVSASMVGRRRNQPAQTLWLRRDGLRPLSQPGGRPPARCAPRRPGRAVCRGRHHLGACPDHARNQAHDHARPLRVDSRRRALRTHRTCLGAGPGCPACRTAEEPLQRLYRCLRAGTLARRPSHPRPRQCLSCPPMFRATRSKIACAWSKRSHATSSASSTTNRCVSRSRTKSSASWPDCRFS